MHLNDAREKRLLQMIDKYDKLGWSVHAPCSRFARDAWQAATGECLRDSKYKDGQSNPTSLKFAIGEVNRGVIKRRGTTEKVDPPRIILPSLGN
jgi:hypothetical protein